MLIESFCALRDYCEREDYKGWDPYDGLNSRLFQALPLLKRSALCRLVVIQGFKRCPVNLRPLAWVPKEYNAKGIGLFLQGYCNLVRVVSVRPEFEASLGHKDELLQKVDYLANLLISLQSKGYSGACWGYNFDWQARRLFLFPKFTPTVVATNFCATALMDAYEVIGNAHYLDVALSAADFILKDLHRAPYRSAEDGSWVYGMLPVQSWIDSFHTGYNLDGLMAYEEQTGDTAFHEQIERGFDFYVRHFFEEDGCPKYYHNRKYPIDIHCPGQLFVTLHRLHKFAAYRELAEKVLAWTVRHMQDKRGYFYYQLKPGISSKIPYMRWSNAFMFNALSYYLLAESEINSKS